MTGLNPELRADKNGKLVTRHVRRDSGSRSGLSRVSAPVIKSEADEEAEQELIGQLINVTNEEWLLEKGIKRWDTLKKVRLLPPTTVRAISEKLKRTGTGTYFGYAVAFALDEQRSVDNIENMTFLYSDDHYDRILDYGADHMYKCLKEDINGLDEYPQLVPGTNYLHAEKEEQNKAKVLIALLKPADEIDSLKVTLSSTTGEHCTSLKDASLVELAVEHADNYVSFLDLVDQRGLNAETLREVLSTTAPLWGGAL